MNDQLIRNTLNGQLSSISLDDKTLSRIKKISKEFCEELRRSLKNKKIKAEVFIGGSLAKDTIIKKQGNYDIDVFVRFDKVYKNEEISEKLGRILKDAKKIHGSRDYYEKIIDGTIIEIIPVLKIKSPNEAENVTDLSYFHVKYILDRIKKNKRLSDEIKLAKTFAYAQECYGAESYIKGFSGYSLELLVSHYGSFLKLVKEMAKSKERVIIDDSKFYKKGNILIELNESKILSPIILIDPTYKERNALAGLSEETFEKFKKSCQDFLNNPGKEFFIKKSFNEKIKNIKYTNEIKVKSNRQKGDIAGTKLKKFFKFFIYQLKKEFNVKSSEFYYNDKENNAFFFFLLDKKDDEVIKGPPIDYQENLNEFKKNHPDYYIKDNNSFVKVNHALSFNEYLKKFKERYSKILKEMSITEIELIK